MFEYQVGDYVIVDFDQESGTIFCGLKEGKFVGTVERGDEEKYLINLGMEGVLFPVSHDSIVDPTFTH